MTNQNWLHRYSSIIVLVILNFISLNLILNDDSAPENAFRTFILDNVTALQSGFDYFGSLKRLKADNEILKEYNIALKRNIRKSEEYALQNVRFRRLFHLSEDADFEYILAEVVGQNPNNFVSGFVLNKGLDDSIRTDMAVVSNEGLVGRIIYVGNNTSVVQLLNDKNMRISCRVQRTRDMGMVGWSAKKMLKLDYFSKTNNLKLGDIIITSGLSTIYPSGIKIGTVRNIIEKDYNLFKEVDVDPAVNFTSLEEVFIVKKKKANYEE